MQKKSLILIKFPMKFVVSVHLCNFDNKYIHIMVIHI